MKGNRTSEIKRNGRKKCLEGEMIELFTQRLIHKQYCNVYNTCEIIHQTEVTGTSVIMIGFWSGDMSNLQSNFSVLFLN